MRKQWILTWGSIGIIVEIIILILLLILIDTPVSELWVPEHWRFQSDLIWAVILALIFVPLVTLYVMMGALARSETSSYDDRAHLHVSRERLDDPKYRRTMKKLIESKYKKGEITGEEYRRYMKELKPD